MVGQVKIPLSLHKPDAPQRVFHPYGLQGKDTNRNVIKSCLVVLA